MSSEQGPHPPPWTPAEPEALPPQVTQVWNSFAGRELARGRRDVSNLVETTLQFILEHETRSLRPLADRLEQLRPWQDALAEAVKKLDRLLATAPAGDLAKPFQRHAIVMDQATGEGQGTRYGEVRQVPIDQPTGDRQALSHHLAQLRSQLGLVDKLVGDHHHALQDRRDDVAGKLRIYAAEMHRMAARMIAELPEEAADQGSAPAEATDAQTQQPPAEATRRGGLSGWLARARSFSPRELAKACIRALRQGYREPPDRDDHGLGG